MLGHASAEMTLDVYAGLFGDDLDTVADLLDGAARRRLRTSCGLRVASCTNCRSRLARGTCREQVFSASPRGESNS